MLRRFFAKKVTENTNHYVDGSRIAVLAKSTSHRYTAKELIVRGSIVVCTAVSAYLGAYYNDEEQTHCSDFSMSVAAGISGFVISHVVALVPILQKRCALSNECHALAKEIRDKIMPIEHIHPFHFQTIQTQVSEIMKLSLSTEDQGNATQTWGRRKRLLTELNSSLGSENYQTGVSLGF